MKRKVKTKVKGFRTTDGAGVKLVRVLGNLTTKEFDPILMLDSFDSINPDDYTAGFPMHPHRGIETISYVSRGKMVHRDSLTIKNGNEKAQVLYMNSRALNEPVAWAGPIVMNTQEELQKAFLELRSNTFIKETAEY